jgi:hypothetical protein
MDKSIQTETEYGFKVEETPEYSPLIEMTITKVKNGKVYYIVLCEFSDDFSTQTEFNRTFDEEVDMYFQELEVP